MIKVGLTGNIGSGKTTVCKIFETIGVPVFYADKVARDLLDDPTIVKKVLGHFGPVVLHDDGKLNRAALAKIVFNDKKSLNYLNAVIHPLVREEFENWTISRQNFPYVIQEAAILIETGLYKEFDKIVVVSAPLQTRVQRVMSRDNVSQQEVQARASNQLRQELLEEKADFVIVNDGAEPVLPRVLQIDKYLKGLQQN